MIVCLVLYGIFLIFSRHNTTRAFRLRNYWLKWMGLPILNIHVTAEGKPIDRPALYVSNHRSFADPLAILPYLDAFVIAKAEVASYPVINKGAELTGVLYVKREDAQSRNHVRSQMIQTIKSGYNVLVFPEGTVSFHSYPMPFRTGSFLEAAKEGIPVIPIAIEFRSKKDLWLIPDFLPQFLYSFSKWKTEVKVSFGPVLTGDDGLQLKENAEQWIKSKMAEQRAGWSEVDFSELDQKEPYRQALNPNRNKS